MCIFSKPYPLIWFQPVARHFYFVQEWNNMRLREIKHCRLAMVGFFFMAAEMGSETAVGNKDQTD